MKPRVLLVTNIFPPMIGGPATFIDRAAHELCRRGWRVTVVCSSETPSVPEDSQRPFKVSRVCLGNRYIYEVMVRLSLFWHLIWHRTVFVNGLEPYFFLANRLLKRNYILKIVGDSVWEMARNRGDTVLNIDEFQVSEVEQRKFAVAIASRNRSVQAAVRIVVPSVYLKRLVERWGVPSSKIDVILNGVEQLTRPTAEVQSRSRGEIRVLFVGRLTNWKGVDTLLIAMHNTHAVKVTIAGDGPCLPALVELAKQLGVSEHVEFLGRQSRLQVIGLMHKCDVLVLTSLYEGLSHTLLEAMASGLPCIASLCGGNSETVTHEVTGLLIPPQDPNALRRAIIRLRDDEEFRVRLAREALIRSQQFDMRTTVSRMAEFIEQK